MLAVEEDTRIVEEDTENHNAYYFDTIIKSSKFAHVHDNS